MPEVKEHLAQHTVEKPGVVPDTKLKTEQLKPSEQAFEQYKQVDEQSPDESPYVIKQASQKKDDKVMTDDVGKSPLQIKVEEVMANGLDTTYQSMTPEQQDKFRKKGEEVAKAIEDLTTKLKLTARKVLQLLRSWLKLIPGVNKFFLEQEAKLKTDEIMKLGREEMLKRRQ
ncbi:MAG: hypothetical protein ACD_34C00121G0003 [uncultured bacterium]|nr:MAG: hypothetical protein ACD_34C00121G0003 [uncultured bacterium]